MKPENLEYEDFAKLDIRKGTILKIEEVPKSKKLLKLEVSFGNEIGVRTILAGIAGRCFITEGQLVLAVLNLRPRKMFDIESHGMILAASDADEKLWLANPGGPVPDGASIG